MGDEAGGMAEGLGGGSESLGPWNLGPWAGAPPQNPETAFDVWTSEPTANPIQSRAMTPAGTVSAYGSCLVCQ